MSLMVIGDGPLLPDLQRAIARRELEKVVVLRGTLPEAGVRETLLQSRALVLPSFIEGLPVTLMEALALCRPAIASRVAGIPELLVDGVSGRLVAPGSVPELMAALREFLETPAPLLQRMGEAGRRAVSERHSTRREADRLAILLRASASRS